MSGAPPSTYAPLFNTKPIKTYIIFGALLVSAAFAQADLGDNYSSVCREYGSRGSVSKDWIWYSGEAQHKTNVWCQFRHNACVAIGYESSFKDEVIIDSEIWRLLLRNSKGVTWTEYSVNPSTGVHSFVSTDNAMYATLSENKHRLLVAYKGWFDRHHMWSDENGSDSNQPTDNSQPPVEDAI